jgi:hypothetical protein
MSMNDRILAKTSPFEFSKYTESKYTESKVGRESPPETVKSAIVATELTLARL